MKVFITIETVNHYKDIIRGVYLSEAEANDAAARWDYQVEEHNVIQPTTIDDTSGGAGQTV